jgi:GNAT superfamily N-acetyltransferase
MTSPARIATDVDAAEIGRTLAGGFADDPVLTWVFQEPGRAAKLASFFDFLAREALVPLGATWLLPGSCAAWTPPDPPPWPPERAERFGAVLTEVCTDDDLGRLGTLDAAMQEHHPSEPLWYLGVIATVPDSRGQGLGRALLEQSLAVVDRTRLPSYLESTNARNLTLYQRHGFTTTGIIELPNGPTLTKMWRKPRA